MGIREAMVPLELEGQVGKELTALVEDEVGEGRVREM